MNEPVAPAKTRVPSIRALRRTRVDRLLAGAWTAPFTLVIAPAGSGKTTLLAQFAAAQSAAGRPVAWYQAESGEAEVADLLRHLEDALRGALPGLRGSWMTVAGAAAALDEWTGPAAALVVDDLHALAGTQAESEIERLIAYLPPALHLIAAARRPPSFNLSRLRVSNHLLEIGPDDLRFRSWEVEELFRNHYGEPLPPEELAELARRTDGWAAGLQLFHLATRGKSQSERRRVLGSMSTRLRDVREYLARNVLLDLDDELRSFMVRTSVLGRLSGPWCDRLLGGSDGARMLEEIERRHLFLTTDDGGLTYREHEVLRSHLEELLIDELGEAAASQLYEMAGNILEEGGAVSEALRAYCRAQDWTAAERLWRRSADLVFDRPGAWVEPLPLAIAGQDAWILLATARRQLAAGDWQGALLSYRRGEDASPGALAAEACRRERFSLTGWLDPTAAVSTDWTSALRRAVTRDPLGVMRELTEGPDAKYGEAATLLVGGLAAALGGQLDVAVRLFAQATEAPQASQALIHFGNLASAAGACLLRRPDARPSMVAAVGNVEALVAPWLGRLLTSFAEGTAEDVLAELAAARTATSELANPWVDAMLAFVIGTVELLSGQAARADSSLSVAHGGFRQVGAPVLAAWASALACLARARGGVTETAQRIADAGQLARNAICPGALALIAGISVPSSGSPERTLHGAAQADGVINVDWMIRSVPTADEVRSVYRGHADATPKVDLRCFGKFEITINGRPIDSGPVKPRVRSLLHFLCVSAGRSVHRDHLLAAFWPDDDIRSAIRSLQVGISALRQLFEREAGPGAAGAITRQGDGYMLAVGRGTVDLLIFEEAIERGRAARQAHDSGAAALASALQIYRGDLLIEAGTAEWVLESRDRYKVSASDAAQSLAGWLMEVHDFDGAAAACERGLEIDRYRDGLWRTLIAAQERRGDRVAAARSSQSYERVLEELGIRR